MKTMTGTTRRVLQALLAAAFVGLLAGCGGGGGAAGTPVLGGGGGGGTGGATAADLVLVLSTSSLPTDNTGSALVTVSAVNANRNTVADVPVTISVDANAIATPSGTKTDATGLVTAAIKIGSDATKRTITVTASSGSISKTAKIDVVDPSTTAQGTGPTISIALSSSQITPSVPATATVTLKSAAGAALSDVVVNLSTSRGNLADLSVASVRTNASGQATATLSASNSGLTGADYLTAFTTISAVSASSQVAFTVDNAVPTLTVNPSAVTLRSSQIAPQVAATVRDSRGLPVANQKVDFIALTAQFTPDPIAALTDSNGIARTTLRLGAGTSSIADSLQVQTTVTSKLLQSSVAVQIVGETPTAAMTVSNSKVTTTQPATVNVTVRDAAGAPVVGKVVEFSSQYGLVKFDATTAQTNASGVATVVAAPVSAASNGGDTIKAQVVVNSVTATDSKSVQVASAASPGTPVLQFTLSNTSVNSASPATATATLTDSRGTAVAGQVVTFTVVRGLGRTNVGTALTDSNGLAVAQLSPTSSASAGADEITASARYAGSDLSATQGFQVQATNATIETFTGPSTLSAYGQTTLSVTLTGATVGSPVKLSISSACAAAGKASVSPASISATSNSFTLQYRDNGCGAVQPSDLLQVVVDGTATAKALTLPITAPAAVSLAFISSSPEQIFLKGSGFTESSIVTFEVRDAAGNPLPNRQVEVRLQTGAGGVTMEGRGVESVDPPSASPFTQTSNASGRVSVRVNSGTQPTPVRVHAKLGGDTIATVSSNLSVGIGLPSQLNFSMSQQTKNIEGYDIDGTPNTYTIIAADRSGNPVPAGTSINFVAEGGQIESIKQIQQVNGISRTTANFVSAEPRPADGRVTIISYALGEESFVDKNGNNTYDVGEDFQDLGNIFKDRNFDGLFDLTFDEYIGLNINNSGSCASTGASAALLALDASIPSVPGTCDGKWSGAGQVYVRRATETVLSTTGARPLWPLGTSNVTFARSPIVLQVSPNPADTQSYNPAGGDVICTRAKSGSFVLIAADANPGKTNPFVNKRLNPMAAGTVITATTSTTGFSTTIFGGSPVPSTTDATGVGVGYDFDTATSGIIFVTFRSPSGTATGFSFAVNLKATCP